MGCRSDRLEDGRKTTGLFPTPHRACGQRRARPIVLHLPYKCKTTGVRKSVTSWEKASPPTTETPSGRRDSPPAPIPSAIGRVPISAAIVVIMMGRKRTRQPLINRVGRTHSFLALRLESEVNHHDGVFLDDADQHDDSDEAVDVQVHIEQRRNPSLRRSRVENDTATGARQSPRTAVRKES